MAHIFKGTPDHGFSDFNLGDSIALDVWLRDKRLYFPIFGNEAVEANIVSK